MISWIDRLRRWYRRCVPGVAEDASTGKRGKFFRPSAARSFAGIHRAAQDARAMVEQQFDHTRALEANLVEIDEQIASAWQELTRQAGDYHGLLQGFLSVLDDCQTLSAQCPELGDLPGRLLRVLKDQDIEPIDTNPGDRFCADLHSCETTETRTDSPPGVVLRVLGTGYLRGYSNGSKVVIRPARVVVSTSSSSPEAEQV
jgi:molecular chaperone GrpE (heat shock protein)